MQFRNVLILLLISAFFSAGAQDLKGIQSRIQTIDSLLVYNKFLEAEKLSDSLFLILEKADNFEISLKVRLQKAIALQGGNQHQKSLSILLDVFSQSEKKNFFALNCESAIYISLIHEINTDYEHAYEYIHLAELLCKSHEINELYSTILVRMASLHRILARKKTQDQEQIRSLEKLGFKASEDSTLNFAKRAIPYAIKYGRYKDEADSYFLIGTILHRQNKDEEAIGYFLKQIPVYKRIQDYEGLFFTYINVSDQSYDLNQLDISLAYTDTALVYYDYVTAPEKYFIYESRAFLFKELNQLDSAYANLEKAISELVRLQDNESNAEIRKLEEEFQNDKHQETIRNQRLQLILVLTLLVVILIATIIYIRKNRLINGQNKIISRQLSELKKTVEQKEILLSELQHRVKNNLQYVISLLEIQKESVGYSSMEDLIRNNQNRIHSIALLHKKLNVDESVDDVELKRYVTELSELVLESYQQTDKHIDLSITCEVATLPLTKAMPVGLIIVELLSNSMKHAFRNKKEGNIEITISYDHENGLNKLRYQDNGKGFDFENVKTKGLGVEITKGLIDQLDAEIETSTTHGFDLTITFK
ncbi:sensor histidine kinase [Jiulongibacter sediminis]|uniref:histidine kinase n=1 Tax=Jiulongibacter sediminis TaxID=1605367 RepID=A0A0P7BRA2_9BACT|nr:sensor histidine kinase [Jiulongibacter sediminis]KPM49787.1 hypothetical protein AFM12_04225 [Jiulongibacter sediminis]TBX26825.1 hypothetical protein TK44_04230 [Jiulongibacter sediminis]